MQINKKIKAFTIAEMLVVLVVSSIIISLALVTLGLVQKQIHSIQKNLDQTNQVIILERLLWQDFNTRKITYNKLEDKLIGISSKDTIVYKFNNTYVLRNKDTLKVSILNKDFYLDAEKITQNKLDAIELTLAETYQNKNLFIFTQKDASYYLNR